jgi:hypothetical protein
MTDAKKKLEEIIKRIGAEMSDEEKASLAKAAKAGHVHTIEIDSDLPPHRAMVQVFMRLAHDMLEGINDAETGDCINAMLNCIANLLVSNSMPGAEADARDAIVKSLKDGLDKVVETSDELYKKNPKIKADFEKLMAIVKDDNVVGTKEEDAKRKYDAIEELKDLKDKRERLMFAGFPDTEKLKVSGNTMDEAGEVDLDWADKVTHKTIGHA